MSYTVATTRYRQPVTEPIPPTPPTNAKPEPSKGAKIAGGIIAALVLFGCIGGAIAIFSGGDKTTPTAVALTPTTAATTGSTVQQIAAWESGGGKDILTSITTDLGDMGTAGSNGDFTAMGIACTSLQTDVESGQAYGPIPAAAVQKPWAAALAQLARASTDCLGGVQGSDSDLLGKAATEITTGTADIKDAVTALSQVAGTTN